MQSDNAGAASPRKKILIIDDDEDVHVIIMEVLKSRENYQYFGARDGKEGIEAAKKILPDLILLDIMMPAIDGFGVQEYLRKDTATESIPIIFVTARTSLEDTIRAVGQGASGYIEKPFDLKRLLRKIDSLMGQNK